MAQDGRRHRRAHGVHGADEEHRAGWITGQIVLPHARHGSAFPMQGADEREEATRGIAVDGDLALEALDQHAAALVVHCAPAHVDGLDARGRRRTDRLVVALADDEVVLDDAPERGQRKHHRERVARILLGDGETQPVLDEPQGELVGAAGAAFQLEPVALQDIEDRYLALVLDAGITAPDRGLVEMDGNEPGLGVGIDGWLEHGRLSGRLSWAAHRDASAWTWPPTSGPDRAAPPRCTRH